MPKICPTCGHKGYCKLHYWSNYRKENAGKHTLKRSPLKRSTKPIKKRTAKEEARLAKYRPIERKFVADHPECQMHLVPECTGVTSGVHHSEGREGDLLYDTSKFVAGCWPCHFYAETHPAEAKEKNISLNRIH